MQPEKELYRVAQESNTRLTTALATAREENRALREVLDRIKAIPVFGDDGEASIDAYHEVLDLIDAACGRRAI